jgi:hypothetical protein
LEVEKENMLEYFLSMLMLVFSITSVIAGIFIAYFGSGKSKTLGALLIFLGLIVFMFFIWGTGTIKFGSLPDFMNFSEVIINSIIAVIGAVIGALIVLGVFLLTILKT